MLKSERLLLLCGVFLWIMTRAAQARNCGGVQYFGARQATGVISPLTPPDVQYAPRSACAWQIIDSQVPNEEIAFVFDSFATQSGQDVLRLYSAGEVSRAVAQFS